MSTSHTQDRWMGGRKGLVYLQHTPNSHFPFEIKLILRQQKKEQKRHFPSHFLYAIFSLQCLSLNFNPMCNQNLWCNTISHVNYYSAHSKFGYYFNSEKQCRMI